VAIIYYNAHVEQGDEKGHGKGDGRGWSERSGVGPEEKTPKFARGNEEEWERKGINGCQCFGWHRPFVIEKGGGHQCQRGRSDGIFSLRREKGGVRTGKENVREMSSFRLKIIYIYINIKRSNDICLTPKYF